MSGAPIQYPKRCEDAAHGLLLMSWMTPVAAPYDGTWNTRPAIFKLPLQEPRTAATIAHYDTGQYEQQPRSACFHAPTNLVQYRTRIQATVPLHSSSKAWICMMKAQFQDPTKHYQTPVPSCSLQQIKKEGERERETARKREREREQGETERHANMLRHLYVQA